MNLPSLDSITLIDIQRRVLKRIAAGRSSGISTAEIFARDDLARLGLIFKRPNGAYDTTKGPGGGEAFLVRLRWRR